MYRGRVEAEKHFGIYSLYVMFFPQLVAGPIERPQNLIHQFKEEKYFDYERVTSGIKLMAWGIFKKVVVADRLAMVVDSVYSNPEQQSSLSILIAIAFFSFQIYCDFSGYTDVARGAARVLGFNLMKNFNFPYHAKSLQEFWQRWHISLSTWFKDYLYIPMGGSRRGIAIWSINILIVFFISGLWHGASWTFVIWGLLHGVLLVLSRLSKNVKSYLFPNSSNITPPFILVLNTFFVVSILRIFFRAESLEKAITIYSQLLYGLPSLWDNILNFGSSFSNFGVTKLEFIIALSSLFLLVTIEYIQSITNIQRKIDEMHLCLRWSVYIGFVVTIVLFGVLEARHFIYFQF